MNLFDGLYPYEIVLMLLGVILFLVLTIAFLILIIRKQPYGKLCIFFSLPIIMIGFSGIKSIQISNSMIVIEKYIKELEKNPTSDFLQESLENELAKVSFRPFADPDSSTTIARAQIAVGNDIAAEARLEEILKQTPQQPVAIKLKSQIEFQRKLEELTADVEKNPTDSKAREKLDSTVREISRYPIARAETITNITRARELLEDRPAPRIPIPDAKPSLNPEGNSTKTPAFKTIPSPKPEGELPRTPAPGFVSPPEPEENIFGIYAIAPNSIKIVVQGSDCIFTISRGGFSSESEANRYIPDTRFRILVDNAEIEPIGDPTTFYNQNGGPWHIEQRFRKNNITAGDHSVMGTTYSRKMGQLDSRSFIIRSR